MNCMLLINYLFIFLSQANSFAIIKNKGKKNTFALLYKCIPNKPLFAPFGWTSTIEIWL